MYTTQIFAVEYFAKKRPQKRPVQWRLINLESSRVRSFASPTFWMYRQNLVHRTRCHLPLSRCCP